MTDDFTCILRDEFKRCIEELPYEELRQSIFTEELQVAARLHALSERIYRGSTVLLQFRKKVGDVFHYLSVLIEELCLSPGYRH